MYDILQLNDMILPELKEIAEKLKSKRRKTRKTGLIFKILDAQALNPETQEEAHKSRDNKAKKQEPANLSTLNLRTKRKERKRR